MIVIELVLGFAPYFVFKGKSVTKNTSEVVTIDVGLADMAVRGFRFGPAIGPKNLITTCHMEGKGLES